MRYGIFFIVLSVTLTVASPVWLSGAVAQDSTLVEYIPRDSSFAFQYPSDWKFKQRKTALDRNFPLMYVVKMPQLKPATLVMYLSIAELIYDVGKDEFWKKEFENCQQNMSPDRLLEVNGSQMLWCLTIGTRQGFEEVTEHWVIGNKNQALKFEYIYPRSRQDDLVIQQGQKQVKRLVNSVVIR